MRVCTRPCLRVILTAPRVQGTQRGPARSPWRSHSLSRASCPGQRLGPGGWAFRLLRSHLPTSVPEPPMHSLQPPSSAQRPGASPNRLTQAVQRSFWRYPALRIQGSPSPHTRNRPPALGGPEGLVPLARETSCGAQTFLVCAGGPGAPAGRGHRLQQASPQTSCGPTMKSVQKQWLEVLGAYQYVLTFLFMGERLVLWGPHGEEGHQGESLGLHL